MTISRVTLGKTINIGDLQSVRVEFTADLNEVESLEGSLERLKMILATEEDKIKRENGVRK